ncbi:MAG: hypothetical protein HYZ44_06290 [Bacteroidetes bacterium]|nr:hypothetical protein [Bacteroidota bacterium]
MNDTIKQNRDQLKANKKKPFEKRDWSTKSENLLQDDRKLSEEERIRLVQAVWQSNKEEARKQVVGFILSVIIVGTLVVAFLAWW